MSKQIAGPIFEKHPLKEHRAGRRSRWLWSCGPSDWNCLEYFCILRYGAEQMHSVGLRSKLTQQCIENVKLGTCMYLAITLILDLKGCKMWLLKGPPWIIKAILSSHCRSLNLEKGVSLYLWLNFSLSKPVSPFSLCVKRQINRMWIV